MSSSRTNAVRAIVGVAAAGLFAVSAAGCGNDVPAGAVAKVGDTVIAKKDFDRLYASAATGAEQQLGVAPELSDLPNFTACVADLKQQQPQGQDAPPDSELRKRCKQTYEQIKQQVMQFLLQSQWMLQEAEEQDVEVSDAEVVDAFEQQKNEAFPKERDYRKFLRDSGGTEQDILFQVKISEVQRKLTEKIREDQEDVSEDDIEEFYEENRENFSQPERRDLMVVLTQTKAKAEQAKRELDGGASFKAVAKRLSIDMASKSNGGRMPGVVKGQQEPALDEALFNAERGEIEGPVKTQAGWYVFEVESITEPGEQPLEDVKATIRTQLAQQSEQEGLQEFIEDFRRDYVAETVCADDYVIPDCSNGPKPADTGPASGGTPGAPPITPGAPGAPGAPPQQGAPQGAAPPQQAPAPQQAAPPQGAPQQAPPPPPAP